MEFNHYWVELTGNISKRGHDHGKTSLGQKANSQL